MRLEPHLEVDELERRYRAAKEPHERSWWQILWLFVPFSSHVTQFTGNVASKRRRGIFP